MTSTSKLKLSFLFLFFALFSCGDNDDDSYYSEWTSIGNGLNSNVTKNVLTEFVGSTNCPYCPADSNSDEYVGSDITKKWFLINYHTNSPSRGDPMYEFHRGTLELGEDDYC